MQGHDAMKNEKTMQKFHAWLGCHGSEVLRPTNPYEVTRFTTPEGVGIIYRDKNGNITKKINGAEGAWSAFQQGNPWSGRSTTPRADRPRNKRMTFIQRIAGRDGWTCAYCGRTLTEHTATIEHFCALSKGGADNLSNMVLACREHNQGAGSMNVREKLELALRLRTPHSVPTPAEPATSGLLSHLKQLFSKDR